jgi:hypothetical protein
VRSDIDENYFRAIVIGKIEDQPVLVRNPERPEPFHDPAQRMGLERRVKWIVSKKPKFSSQTALSFPGAGGSIYGKYA